MRKIKLIIIIFGLVVFNLLALECLLRVGGLFENIAESRLDKELKNADHIFDFSPNMKDRLESLQLEGKYDLDYHGKNNRIQYKSVENYNPYPPILNLFDTAYIIYNKDFKLKQITILSGECDATPSFLVDKERGEQTGSGDYFVTYIFYQNEISGTGVDYDRIDWYSWRGGSYDGFEELWFFPMIIAELLILALWVKINRRKNWKQFLGQ